MDTPKTEETTHSDSTEPIVSWSGVQGETQSEDVEIPNAEKLDVEENKSENATSHAKDSE